jgi:hypothetical protein
MDNKDRLNAVITSVPANATAARVMGRGEQSWKPANPRPFGRLHWDHPPPMKDFFGEPHKNFTGRRFGRFVVVGLLDQDGGKRWVVRCACGDFEVRTPQSIALRIAGFEPNDSNPCWDRCWNCGQLTVIQKRYVKKGSQALSTFTNPAPSIETPAAPKRKDPRAIIASAISQNPNADGKTIAAKIWDELCANGYRIIRDISTLSPTE